MVMVVMHLLFIPIPTRSQAIASKLVIIRATTLTFSDLPLVVVVVI